MVIGRSTFAVSVACLVGVRCIGRLWRRLGTGNDGIEFSRSLVLSARAADAFAADDAPVEGEASTTVLQARTQLAMMPACHRCPPASHPAKRISVTGARNCSLVSRGGSAIGGWSSSACIGITPVRFRAESGQILAGPSCSARPHAFSLTNAISGSSNARRHH